MGLYLPLFTSVSVFFVTLNKRQLPFPLFSRENYHTGARSLEHEAERGDNRVCLLLRWRLVDPRALAGCDGRSGRWPVGTPERRRERRLRERPREAPTAGAARGAPKELTATRPAARPSASCIGEPAGGGAQSRRAAAAAAPMGAGRGRAWGPARPAPG